MGDWGTRIGVTLTLGLSGIVAYNVYSGGGTAERVVEERETPDITNSVYEIGRRVKELRNYEERQTFLSNLHISHTLADEELIYVLPLDKEGKQAYVLIDPHKDIFIGPTKSKEAYGPFPVTTLEESLKTDTSNNQPR